METRSFTKRVADLVRSEEAERECPLPISVIPNYMGINLCSVDSVSWVRREDGQLVSLTIHFAPATEEERAGRGPAPTGVGNTGAPVDCRACDGSGERPAGTRCPECGGKGCVCAVCKSTAASTPHVRVGA